MGLTHDYLKFVPNGVCNVVGSVNGVVQAIDNVTCAVAACESVNFFNMRTLEMVFQISKTERTVTVFKANVDRSLIAVGYDNGEVCLHKKSKDKEVATFAGHRISVNTLAFSDDGLMLASGGKDSIINVWDIVSESGMFRLSGHKNSITQLQFTSDNKHLISSSKDFQVKFWNIASQSCFYTLTESMSEVYAFGLLNSDRLLVVGSANVELLIFELSWLDRLNKDDEKVDDESTSTYNIKKARKADTMPLVGANYINEENNQGNTIVRCKKRGTLLRQSKERTRQIAVSFDNTILCCVGKDKMDIYRVYTAEESQKRFLKKLQKEKRKRELEDSGKSLENEIARDITLIIGRVGEYTANAKLKWIDFHRSLKYLGDERREYRLYCLLANNDVQGVLLKLLKNQVTSEQVVSLGQRGHRTDVTSLSFASSSSVFLSCSAESAILWDYNSLLPKNRFTDDAMKSITASLFSPNDREIILTTKDGSIFIFDLAECKLLEVHKVAHDNMITAIKSFPNKNGFITVGADKKAKFWHYQLMQDFEKKRLTIRLDRVLELQDEPLCVAVSSNGKFVVFGLLDNTARVYYFDSLRFFVSFYGHSLPIYCVDISPDSKLVVTGSGDKTVKIWGLDFGDCHKSIFAHDENVTFVKFGADVEGKLFWSAGRDGKLKQWDAVKFNKVQTLKGHTREINALCSTTDGRLLVSASHDKSIRLWELSNKIINLQEEEENERENQYEEKLVDAEDIIAGETENQETGLAPIKSIDSIKSTESILECIDILRTEILERERNLEHKPHLLLLHHKTNQLDHFVLDVLEKVRSSHLEKSLMMVPLSYVPDILKSLCKCVQHDHRSELCCRVILFLIKIHHTQILNSFELLPLISKLKTTLLEKVSTNLDQIGFNVAALRLFQFHLEEQTSVKLFRDVSAVEKEKKKNKLKKHKKVNDVAIIHV